MALFKKVVTSTGISRFFKDGKYVKVEEVGSLPAVVRQLEDGGSVEIGEPPVAPAPVVEEEKPEDKTSVISGEPGERQKFLNGKSYWVTKEEYSQLNLGKFAQYVREHNL